MMKQTWQHVFCSTVMFLFVLPIHSQSIATDYTPFQAVPRTSLPASNGSGSFLWPLAGSVELYEIGSIMNISWSADFARTNISLVPNFDSSIPIPLLSGTPATNYEWTVQCFGNCNVPWVLRATDTDGDADAQETDGFVSEEFWVTPAAEENTSESTRDTTTTFIRSTITISPPRLTITLNSTIASAQVTSSGSNHSSATVSLSASSTRVPTSTTDFPATTPPPAMQSETSGAVPPQQSSATQSVGYEIGIVAAIFGAMIGWLV